MLETQGQGGPGRARLRAALANAPPDQASTRRRCKPSARARVVHGAYTRQLGEHIRGQVADVRGALHGGRSAGASSAFIDTTLRVRRRYRQEPTEYYYPGLPAIEFYERERVSVARGVRIGDRGHRPGTRRHRPRGRSRASRRTSITTEHMPLDQWRELNHSPAGVPITSTSRAIRSRIAVAARRRRSRRSSRAAAGDRAAALALRDVLGARAEDANSASHRRGEFPSGRASAACRAAGLRVPGRRRDAGMAGGRGAGCSTTRSSTRPGTTATNRATS